MLDKLPKKIKELRIAKGYKQEELGERIGLTRDAISKWENGKNIPRLPELLSLAMVFEMNLSELLQEIDEERKSMVNSLLVKDVSALKTIEYFGLDETYSAAMAYWNEEYQDTRDFDWFENNTFLFLINRKTKEINGIRDFGMFNPAPTDYLFVSDYLPFHVWGWQDKEKVKVSGEKTLEKFEKEISNAIKVAEQTNKQPLFLYDHGGTNNYIAWSFNEKKAVCVYGYKSYRENFEVSDLYCFDENQIAKDHNYMIIAPSDELIKSVGLLLYSDTWNIKMPWDKWEKRNTKGIVITDWDFCKEHEEIYNEAIQFINMSRENDCGCDEEFTHLEKRVTSYEKSYAAKVPIVVLQGKMGLLINALEKLKDKLFEKTLAELKVYYQKNNS